MLAEGGLPAHTPALGACASAEDWCMTGLADSSTKAVLRVPPEAQAWRREALGHLRVVHDVFAAVEVGKPALAWRRPLGEDAGMSPTLPCTPSGPLVGLWPADGRKR